MELLIFVCVIWLVVNTQKINKLEQNIKTLYKITANLTKSPEHPVATKEKPLKTESTESKSVENKIQENNNKNDFSSTNNFNIEFEKLFLGNIFNKIGAISLIIALIIFLKLAHLTQTAQIILAYLLGLGTIAAAVKMHKGGLKNYSEIVMGIGIGVLYITTYCGTCLYRIIPTSASILIGGILILSAYYIAQKFKSFSTFAIGLFAGYLNPFFVYFDITINFLYCYLIFLNLISIVYVFKNSDKKLLNIINMLASMFTILIYTYGKIEITIGLPLCFWALYIVNDVLTLSKNDNKNCNNIDTIISILNYFILILFTIIVYSNIDTTKIATVILLAGIMYGGLAITYKSKDFAYSLIISIFFATHYLCTGTIFKSSFWAIEAVIMAFIAKKYNYKFLHNWILYFICSAIVYLIYFRFGNWSFYVKDPVHYLYRIGMFGIPIVSSLISSNLMKKQNKEVSDILDFLFISSIYLVIVSEIDYLTQILIPNGLSNMQIYTQHMSSTFMQLI